MKKVKVLIVFLFIISSLIFAQELCLPTATYYESLLKANGCGSKNTAFVPEYIFHDICDKHDIDYSTIGRSKDVSDFAFYSSMINACKSTFGNNVLLQMSGCKEMAGIYFVAVTVLGNQSYNRAQALSKELENARKSNRGMCYSNDVLTYNSGNTYFIAVEW